MRRPDEHRPNFIEAYLGLILNPAETTAALFSEDRPPFILSTLLVAFLSTVGPLAAQVIKYDYPVFHSLAVESLVVVFVLTFISFVFIEAIVLAILGFGFAPLRVLACLCYTTAPLVGALWLIYFFNYLGNGRLTLTSAILTGETIAGDPTLLSMPYVVFISQILMAIVFFFSIRTMLRLGFLDGLLIAILSLIPLYGSILVGLFAADIVRPGTITIFLKIINSADLFGSYWS